MAPFQLLVREEQKLQFIDDIVYSGCTGQQVIGAVRKWTLEDKQLDDFQKARIAMLVCDTETNLFEGGRDDLNLLLFFEKLTHIIRNKK